MRRGATLMALVETAFVLLAISLTSIHTLQYFPGSMAVNRPPFDLPAPIFTPDTLSKVTGGHIVLYANAPPLSTELLVVQAVTYDEQAMPITYSLRYQHQPKSSTNVNENAKNYASSFPFAINPLTGSLYVIEAITVLGFYELTIGASDSLLYPNNQTVNYCSTELNNFLFVKSSKN